MLLSNLALGSTNSTGALQAAHGLLLTHLMSLLQTNGVPQMNTTLLMWFVGIAVLALVLQAVVLLGMALGGAKMAKELMKYIEEARAKAIPLIDSTQILVKDLTPQIKTITSKVEVIAGHVESISAVAAEKVHEFSPMVSAARQTVEEANQTIRDANRKTQEQVMRVNGMITAALDSTSRAGAAIQRGISMPGREVAGIVSGVKAVFESLLGGRKASYESSGSPYRGAAARYSSMSEEKLGRPAVSETREFGR